MVIRTRADLRSGIKRREIANGRGLGGQTSVREESLRDIGDEVFVIFVRRAVPTTNSIRCR